MVSAGEAVFLWRENQKKHTPANENQRADRNQPNLRPGNRQNHDQRQRQNDEGQGDNEIVPRTHCLHTVRAKFVIRKFWIHATSQTADLDPPIESTALRRADGRRNLHLIVTTGSAWPDSGLLDTPGGVVFRF
jgi:hypothetical protein